MWTIEWDTSYSRNCYESIFVKTSSVIERTVDWWPWQLNRDGFAIIRIRAGWVIKISRSAVKHPYPPIKVSRYNSILATDRMKRSGRFTGTKNILSPRNQRKTFTLSLTESFTYSTRMNYNPLRIACCTISALLNEKEGKGGKEKRPEVIARCLEYCIRIKGSLSRNGSYSRATAALLSRKLKSIARWSECLRAMRFASSRATRIIPAV